MDFKISIIDATPEELGQVLFNLNSLSKGSTTIIETGSKNVTAKYEKNPTSPVGVRSAEPEAESDEEYRLRKEKEDAETEQATKKTAAAPATRTRRTRAQIEEDEKADAEAKKSGTTTTRKKVADPMPNLTQQMMELAQEVIDSYQEDDGIGVVQDILKTFGVDELADVSPADRMPIMAAFRKDLES